MTKKLDIETQSTNRYSPIKATEQLPEQVIKNVETIDRHQDRHRQNTKPDRRVLNKAYRFT